AVLAAFKQHGHHNLRISARRDANKPAVVIELFACSAFALAERIADNLRAAGFAGKIHALDVGAWGRSSLWHVRGWSIYHARHGIGDGDPVLGINRHMYHVRHR